MQILSHRRELSSIYETDGDDPLMSQREYAINDVSLSSLLAIYNENADSLLYGDANRTGYPITEVLQAVAYVIANDNELFGKSSFGSNSFYRRSFVPY